MYRLWNTLDLRKSSQSMNALLLITCTCFELSLSLQFPHGSYLIQLHPRETLFIITKGRMICSWILNRNDPILLFNSKMYNELLSLYTFAVGLTSFN